MSRAMLCKAYGPPESLVWEETASAALGPRDLRIAVRAAGVNFPDVLMIEGKYQFKPPMPFAPGAEVAGDVLEVGSEVHGFHVGDRVIGMTGWGGFAEQVVVAAARALRMPASMSYEVGAGFSMTYGTSYHALVQRGRLREGETLLVHGATGGVGTAAIEIGLKLGAKLIATGGKAEKLARLREIYGIEHTIDTTSDPPMKEQVKALTGGQGADVVYDAVGGPLLEQSLRCIAWDGRLLVVGFASGEIPKVAANLVLLKGCSIVGVFWGAFTAREPAQNEANFTQLFRWFEEGALRPQISHRIPMERAAEALNALVRREVVGKAVLLT